MRFATLKVLGTSTDSPEGNSEGLKIAVEQLSKNNFLGFDDAPPVDRQSATRVKELVEPAVGTQMLTRDINHGSAKWQSCPKTENHPEPV